MDQTVNLTSTTSVVRIYLFPPPKSDTLPSAAFGFKYFSQMPFRRFARICAAVRAGSIRSLRAQTSSPAPQRAALPKKTAPFTRSAPPRQYTISVFYRGSFNGRVIQNADANRTQAFSKSYKDPVVLFGNPFPGQSLFVGSSALPKILRKIQNIP